MQWRHVEATVRAVKQWSDWPVRRSLVHLGVSRAAYYRWRRRTVSQAARPAGGGLGAAAHPRAPHAVLPAEREAVIRYAKSCPSPRHRELAWKMVDDDVAYLSASTVYRLLREEDLVPTWPPRRRKRRREDHEKARRPDERWQSDIRYVRIGGHRYYLVLFIDEYSRYVVHHELMCWLDGDTLALEAQRAIETLPPGPKPVIQTDNGSGYISQEFKKVLNESGIGHVRIRPHCPEENGLVERAHRTLGELLDEVELKDLEQARQVIGEIVRRYNTERLHGALQFLRPADYYRGNPEQLLEARRRKLAEARHRRRERNLEIKQQTIAYEAVDSEARHSLISQPLLSR